MENVIVAQNCDGSLANLSTFASANSTEPELKLPFRKQQDAPQDLKLVSWPPRKRLPVIGKIPSYRYDVAKGIDTYIYIIDNGINKDNAVRAQNITTTLSSVPNIALGIQINALAAPIRRVALRLRRQPQRNRQQPSRPRVLRRIQSRRLENRRFQELPSRRDEIPPDDSGRQLRLRRRLGRHHRQKPSGPRRGRLPRDIATGIRRRVRLAPELAVGERAHPGAVRPRRRRGNRVRQRCRALFGIEHAPGDLELGSKFPLDRRRGCDNGWHRREILAGHGSLVGNRLGAGREHRLCERSIVAGVGGQKRYFVRGGNGKHQPSPPTHVPLPEFSSIVC